VKHFNGTMRRDLLNVEDFDSLLEARVLVRRLEPRVQHAATTSRTRSDDTTRIRSVAQCGSAMMVVRRSHSGPVDGVRISSRFGSPEVEIVRAP
jgi:hypothetical protein